MLKTMEPEIWAKIVGALLLLLFFLARTKLAKFDGTHRILKYSWSIRITAVSVLVGCYYVSRFFYEINDGALSTLALLSILLLLALSIIAEVFLTSVRFNEREIISVNPWGGMNLIRRENIEQISYDDRWNRIVVCDSIGNTIAIQRLLSGFLELRSYLMGNLPDKIVEQGTDNSFWR